MREAGWYEQGAASMISQPAINAAPDVTQVLDGLPRDALPRGDQASPDLGAILDRAPAGRYLALDGAGHTRLIRLDREVMHVGRGVSVDIRLDDKSISRRHAILAQRPTGCRLLDDRSANGTFVNGRRVEVADLRSGDVIVLGAVILRYLEVAPSDSPAPPTRPSPDHPTQSPGRAEPLTADATRAVVGD
jgi:FHA domain